MAGQLIGLLLLGLLAAGQAAQYLSGTEAGRMHGIASEQMLQRYASAYRSLLVCSAGCDAERLVAALQARDARFELLERLPPLPQSSEDAVLLAALRQKIGGPADLPLLLRVRTEDAQLSPLREETLLFTRAMTLKIAARLPDGRWLAAQQWPVVRDLWHSLGYSLLASGLSVLVVVVLFVRRLLRPLRALARASEQISRGERAETLPVRGPREFRELAMAFNLMQERLTRFVADRTRMLAALSHDFRTPITSLRLRVEMVEDAGLRRAMTRTLEEMRQMVEATLLFARDESFASARETIDLAVLLDCVQQEHGALGHEVSWRGESSLPYRCNPLGLKRVLGNLVDNAVRYGQRARIALLREADGVHIHVDDDGPGLAEEWLEKVFEPFVRPDAGQDRASGGVGLGLAITRAGVVAHGGRLRLENRADGGLRAHIVLPL
ncbi:MAG: two-component sensor histidine kinase [Candidatus Dactylopiibacterium carminicum]|uniref:histidine kinase n=1 Tax=Candidatus Dactylopiibacterium carminicum TaxID=857335 RepID=A0A272EV37_9RHOO|nr:two-component sensor histidine kinase [Candidatus Dactylopiibacterium carminicum]PAS93978.1 MAG: two-component sensor histidine kinase [Candidatus Dactylopiibacterium carminicum]